jgi:uncharacterized protein DUF4230
MTDSDERPPRKGSSLNQLLTSAILLAILLVILVVGYLIVNTIMALSAPVVGIPQAFSTQAQQILHPTPTIIASPVTVIRQIRSLSRLETVSYKIEKVITAESGEGAFAFLSGDKLLLIAEGEVIAGIDLGRLGDNDVDVIDNAVTVTLPSSEIFVATLDNQNTRVYDRQTGLLGPQIDLETLARRQAEAVILDAAIKDGILDTAQKNGEQVIQKLLEALGFENITITTAPPTSDQNRGNK